MAAKKKTDEIDDAVVATIEKTRKNLAVKHGAERVRKTGVIKGALRGVIPTGIDVLDRWVLGCGGLAIGRLSETYSEEGGGKTSILHQWLAAVQRIPGGIAVLCETEDAFDEERAETFGVDLNRLILLEPDTLEQTLHMIETTLDDLAGSKGPVLIGWDSVAGTATEREIEEGVSGKQKVGDRAKAMSLAMRTLSRRIKKANAHLALINQVRENIGVMFGDKFVTPGGRAAKFHSSQRCQLMGGKAVKDADSLHTAKLITFLSTKNRFAPPYRKALIKLDYKHGWDNDWTTFSFAKDRGVIDKGLRFNAPNVAAANKALAEHKDFKEMWG